MTRRVSLSPSSLGPNTCSKAPWRAALPYLGTVRHQPLDLLGCPRGPSSTADTATRSRLLTTVVIRLPASCYGLWQPHLFAAGTGIPGIFTVTAPNWLRVVKNRVFQSSPPKARLVVAEAPCTIRPSFL